MLTLKQLICFSLVLIGSLQIEAIAAKTNDRVEVSLSMLDRTHIKLEYKLPKHCNEILLNSPYQERTAAIRKDWRSLNNCGYVDKDGLLRRKDQCASVSFSIPIKASFMDRTYPTAYPFNEQGVFTHTGIFAISPICGEIDWSFNAPKGAVIINGSNRGENTTIAQASDESIAYTGVFLSYKSREEFPPMIANAEVPDWLVDGIAAYAQEITAYYKKTYPLLTFTQPTLLVSNTSSKNASPYQADVSAPRMIRLSFNNASTIPNAEYTSFFRGIIAHEFAHLLQPKLKTQPYVSEGGAEFIRWSAENHLNWRDEQTLTAEFSSNLFDCLTAAGSKSWSAFEREDLQLGRDIYQCGLVVHLIALASRKNSESAEASLEALYKNWPSNPNAQLFNTLECNKPNNGADSWLNRLDNSTESFAQLVDQQLTQLGLIRSNSYSADPNNFLILSARAFGNLMLEDCGLYSYWTNADNFHIDNLPKKCKTLVNGLDIATVNGVSYFTAPLEAIAEQNKSCSTKGMVTLGTLTKEEIAINCTQEFQPQKLYYELDADKLLSLLASKKANQQNQAISKIQTNPKKPALQKTK